MATKEATEVVVFIEKLANSIVEAKADGKIDWKDSQHVMPLIEVGRQALKDSQLIVEELKTASGEDASALYVRFATAVAMLLDALLR